MEKSIAETLHTPTQLDIDARLEDQSFLKPEEDFIPESTHRMTDFIMQRMLQWN
jgi:hypothetical protein